MRKSLLPILSFFAFLLATNFAYAQYSEIGVFGGVSNYIGDLQPRNMATENFCPAYGLRYHLNVSPRFGISLAATKADIRASDSQSKVNQVRNLNVKTQLYELSAQMEFNLMRYDLVEQKNSTPYLFLGVGGLYFNPQAEYKGKYYNLQPLGTEGQGTILGNGEQKYQQFQVVIPAGIGFKIGLNRRTNLGIETGIRQTFTDYLDDVSGVYPDIEKLSEKSPFAATLSYRTPEFYGGKEQPNPKGQRRGDSYKTDLYFFTGLTLTINLGDDRKMEYRSEYRDFWKN